MVGAPGQAPSAAAGAHLVLYDGVCGLCNRLLQFLLTHDRRAVFALAALQSEVGKRTVARFGGDPTELTSFYVVANYRGHDARMLGRSRAALFVANELGWPWRIALALRVLPTAILEAGYDLIARHRYRMFGRYEQCMAPRPEFKGRFVE